MIQEAKIYQNTHLFLDRRDAGKLLAKELSIYAGATTVVLALPRGGVVLGREVADYLYAPLDVLLVRKIGYPGYEEYAIGAVVEGQPPLYNRSETASVSPDWLYEAEKDARDLMQKRRNYYFDGLKQQSLRDRTVIIVDDGIATGLTMEAAVQAVRKSGARHIIVAVPVAPARSVKHLQKLVDHVVTLDNPEHFLGSVGNHYQEFNQVSDKEVRALLRKWNRGGSL